jgi:polyphosphate kinase
LEKQLMNIISYNLKDNVNSYVMQEDGTYIAKQPEGEESEFNVHKEFFNVDAEEVMKVKLV